MLLLLKLFFTKNQTQSSCMSPSLIVWVKEVLESEVNGWNLGRRRGATSWWDNMWEREETGLKEKNKPPNHFLKLLRTMRYELRLFSTVLVILRLKRKVKTSTKWPRIFQQLLRKIRLGKWMKIGLDKWHDQKMDFFSQVQECRSNK